MMLYRAPKAKVRAFRRLLLRWGRANRRAFPWRETRDPYKLLIAEFILQKTDAPKAVRAYNRLLRAYPTVEHLARARPGTIRKHFAPIGLVKRADYLSRAAAAIADEFGGRVPAERRHLVRLPGVGNYTANAVACMARGRRLPMLDESQGRVLRRVFSLPSTREAWEDRPLWVFAQSLMPPRQAREYNLALLDLAATVCRPRHPRHADCPLLRICDFAQPAR